MLMSGGITLLEADCITQKVPLSKYPNTFLNHTPYEDEDDDDNDLDNTFPPPL